MQRFFTFDWVTLLTSGTIGTVIGGLLTALGKAFWVRWIEERALPTQELLSRLDSGKITHYGRTRLEDEAYKTLDCWRNAMPVPPDGKKLLDWPTGRPILHIRSLSEPPNQSACPRVCGADPPLYFVLDREDVAELVGQLQAEFTRLDQAFKVSKALISQLSIPPGLTPRVWICALHIPIREKRQIDTLLQKLSAEVKKVIPTAAIALEVHAPSEFAEIDDVIAGNPEGNVPALPAARYAFLRDRATHILSGRCNLGELKLPEKLVPSEKIAVRLKGILNSAVTNLSTWRTIAISGPPGSGKTELGQLLLQELPDSAPLLILTATTPGILAMLRALPEQITAEDTYAALINAICHDAIALVPPELRATDDWSTPFADALLANLRTRRREVLIVLDDAHVHSEVMASVNRLRTGHAGFRFLIIGRARVKHIRGEGIVSYECSLWTREDAEGILRSWVSDSNRRQIDSALQRGWPARQKLFSLYLLRAMAENIDSLERAPSELLNKALRGHIAPISQLLTLEHEPPTIVLERIKSLLKNPAVGREELIAATESKTEFEPALILGIMAWQTNFSQTEVDSESGFQRAFLQAERVVQFSRGMVPSKEIAEQLLQAGAQAKIFDQTIGAFSNVYSWRDKLVSDGCAALYLAYEIEVQSMEDRSIASCLECLAEKNSLDILALALDLTLLLRLITAISTTRPSLAHVVDNLLTVEVVDRLGQMAGCLEAVSEKLFHLSRAVNVSHLPDASRALAKVMRSSEAVRSRCWDFIRSASSGYAMTALAAIATEHPDSEAFFEKLENNQLPEFMRPVALEAAARVWTNLGWVPLSIESTKLINLKVARERIESAWSCWLERQSTSHVLQVGVQLLHGVEILGFETSGLLTAIALKHVIETRSPADRQNSLALFGEIGSGIRSLAAKGQHSMAADLVKWLAVQYAPELVAPNQEWIVTRDGSAAFPRSPFKADSIKGLFSRLSTVRRWYILASSAELRSLGVQGGLELVRDALGDQFSYDEELMPGQIQAWDGSAVNIVPRWQIRSEAFAWRPRFSIPA